jgi:hypothetical protein
MKQPVLYVKMDLEDSKEVTFEVSKGQLKGILESFEEINEQLSGLAQTMGGQE